MMPQQNFHGKTKNKARQITQSLVYEIQTKQNKDASQTWTFLKNKNNNIFQDVDSQNKDKSLK